MKNLISNIEFHPVTLLLVIIMLLSGHIKLFLLFMLIIIVHELGHISASLFFKWKINKILILPFGAIIYFDNILNKPLFEELVVAISGPTFQILFFILFRLYFPPSFANYNAYILIFNMLPIYPLDGNKILSFFLNKYLCLNKSNRISYLLSLSIIYFLIYIFFTQYNLLFILILLILLFNLFKYKNNLKNIYNNFLLDRLFHKTSFKKVKKTNNINDFYRDYKHIVKKGNIYISEIDALKEKYRI